MYPFLAKRVILEHISVTPNSGASVCLVLLDSLVPNQIRLNVFAVRMGQFLHAMAHHAVNLAQKAWYRMSVLSSASIVRQTALLIPILSHCFKGVLFVYRKNALSQKTVRIHVHHAQDHSPTLIVSTDVNLVRGVKCGILTSVADVEEPLLRIRGSSTGLVLNVLPVAMEN
ncbi:unnamed protein product [Agarophyton chilense]